MNIHLNFKNIEATESLKAYAQKKTGKLFKYLPDENVSIDWFFTVEREDQIAHCHIKGDRRNYFSESSTSDLYASIDDAVDKLERQLRRHKEIGKDHLHRHGIPEGSPTGGKMPRSGKAV